MCFRLDVVLLSVFILFIFLLFVSPLKKFPRSGADTHIHAHTRGGWEGSEGKGREGCLILAFLAAALKN